MLRRLCVVIALLSAFLSTAAWADPLFYVCNNTPGTVTAVAADGSKTQIASNIAQPHGITMDQMGNLYVTTWGSGPSHGGVAKIDGSTHAVTSLVGGLWSPYGIIADSGGNIFFTNVTSSSTGEIRKITPGGTVSTFAPNIGSGPGSVAFDKNGDLFACCWYDGTVVKITPDATVSVVASGLSQPNGVAFDSSGIMYVDEFYTGKLYKVASDGNKTLFASGFSQPTGLAFDANDNLYVANYAAGSICKVTPSGSVNYSFVTGLGNYGPDAIVMNTIPEPASLALLGGGVCVLLLRRRRQN